MKRFLLILVLVMVTGSTFGYPNYRDPNVPKVDGGMFLWDGTMWRPVAGSASGVLNIGAVVTISSITAELAPGVQTIGSIGAILKPLPAGTNLLGSFTINQTTPGVTNGIDPSATSVGSASGNPTRPFGVLAYLTDNSTLQRWFTAIVLGDGVNGNNIAAIAPWIFNGSSWDRMPGNATDGVKISGRVNMNAFNGFGAVVSITVGTSTAVILPTLSSPGKYVITSTGKVNIGDANVSSATSGVDFIPGNCPGFEYVLATTTPPFYFIAQSATVTVNIKPELVLSHT